MSICFKTFQPTVLLSCEMKQKTCGAGKAIGREKPGLGVKYMMTVVLEMVYYCWIFPEMLFSSRINCILEQGQILCSPPLLLITKVSEEAWGSMHLNIFFFFFFLHLRGGACPRGLEGCCCPPAGEFICQHSGRALSSMDSNWRLITQQRWGEKNKGQSICVRASGQPHGAVGESTGNAIYHGVGYSTNTRSGCSLSPSRSVVAPLAPQSPYLAPRPPS